LAPFEGNPGPYILYPTARIKTILPKYGEWKHLNIQTPPTLMLRI
jgi:arginyl-tRNA synthetase